MFSPAVGRVARCANTFSASPASCLVRVALTPAPPQPFRPSHQRRLSSSKPSTPPNSKKKATELDQNATAKLEGSTRGSKGAKRKLKAPSSATSGTNVPFVAPTNHLRVDDVNMSAFFGLHRPISISRSLPGVTSIAQFDALFDVAQSNDAQTIQAAERAMAGFLERVHAEIDIQEEQRADAVHSEHVIYHLDTQPTQHSVESWAARLVPFSPPAAPVPYNSLSVESEGEAYSAHDLSASINERITEVPLPTSHQDRPTPFRQHVARRRFGSGMLLISVKRQRKLKMKKHKYKKLMKRTRLERRKLDRT